MWGRVQHWILTNFGQLVPHVLTYLLEKIRDDPSCTQSLTMILVLGLCRGLVRVLCF